MKKAIEIFFSIFLSVLFLPAMAYALEYGCQVPPKDLNAVGTRMVESFVKQKKSVPESLVITADFESTDIELEGSNSRQLKGTLEGFYRPATDDFYSLIPIPVLGIALSRERNMVYLCAHFDEDPAKTHVTVYMMRGYHLDPTSLKTAIGNTFSKPQLEVKPLTASLLGISKIREDFLFLLKWLPFMEIGFDATNGIQRLLANILGDFTGIGVERLTMTFDSVEIAAGVDLENPRKAFVKKTISLDKKSKQNK